MLSKIRQYVPKDTLRPIYYGICSSLLTYGSQIWGQIQNKHVKRLSLLQNKAIRIINFASYRSAVDPLYKTSEILKLCDIIKLQNFFYVTNSINGNLPSTLKITFALTKNAHKHNTPGSAQHQIVIPKNTLIYGIRSIKYQSTQIWNFIMNIFPHEKLYLKKKIACKRFLTNYLIKNY